MQMWLSYPLYILSLFTLGPSTDQGWLVSWVLQLLRLVLFLLVTRRFIAPFILAKLSDRIRVRSISLRSVRGLYYKQGDLVWNVDRIGLAYHRPTKERARGFAVQVEGLRLNVLHVPGAARQHAANHGTAAIHKRLSSLFVQPTYSTPVVAHPNWRSSALTPLRLLAHALDPFARPMLRMLFLTGFRIFVRSLPALTQVLEFEMDSAVVSFDVLRGAHLRVSGVTISTQVQFEGLDAVIRGTAADEAVRGFAFGNFAGWNTRMRASAGRLWDRGWGNSRGAASVSVKIGEIAGSTQPLVLDPFVESPLDMHAAHAGRKGTFLAVRCPVDFRAAVRFNPRRVQLEAQSLDLSVDLAGVEVKADVLQALVDLVEEAQRLEPAAEYFSTERSLSPPTSPLLGAWSEMSNIGTSDVVVYSGKRKPTAVKRLAPFVRNIRIGLQAVTTTFRTPDAAYLYRLSLDSLAVQARLSTPQSNHLHQQWLGSKDSRECAEGVVFDVSSDLRTLALERADGPGMVDIWMPLVAVTRINCRALVTDVVFGVKCRKRVFAGDPNSAFVACELTVDHVSVTERLDAINESLAQAERTVHPPRKNEVKPSHDMPRIHLDLLVRDVNLVILRKTGDVSESEIALHIRTDGFEFHIESAFIPHCVQKPFSLSSPAVPEHNVLSKLRFNGTAILHAVFMRVTIQGLPEHLSDVAQEPFVSLDKVEVFLSGDAYALPTEDVAVVNATSLMVELSCISDALAIDLWNPLRVDALARLASSLHVSQQPKQNSQTAPLDMLRAGINARVSVRDIVVIVTEPDVNPDCDLDLSRGLALRTSVSVSYCFMQSAQHSERTRTQRLKTGSNRQRLGLLEDLLVQAVAKANAHSAPEDLTALVHIMAWQTSCRTAVATEVAADHESSETTFGMSHSPTGPAVLSSPMIVGRITLQRRHQRALFDAPRHSDTCDVQVQITSLAATFNLLNVYSALLAMKTLRKLALKRSANTSKPPSQLQTSLRVTVEVFDVFFGMPRGQRLFLRAETMLLEKMSKLVRARSQAFKVFVPCNRPPEDDAAVAERWEELGQITAFTASVTESDMGERDSTISADSLSVRVPSGYKISDLTLDVTVAVKATKHLSAMVAGGEFFAHPPPEAEAAKKVPNIHLRVGSVMLEAEDLALDRKLNLIWQAGSLAQPVRLEREAAFEAKCAAIHRDTDLNPLANIGARGRYNFTAKHMVSIGDARDRLNMVHSMSWVRRFNQTRTDQMRAEDQATKRVRKFSSSSSERPYPIQRRVQDQSTPLIRIRIAGLQFKISRPSFESGSLPDFLHDLGNGIPLETQYTLLVPLHIEASLVQGSVQLRNYPLPLLFIPQHPTEPVPAFEFSTDLVIAEEIGPDFSTKWVDCPVVPANSGMPGAHPLQFTVPKTAMPVKTYARPVARVTTAETTHISWGVSYLPAMQEVLRFVDTLTTPPEDNANPVGFWDKLRLVMHWQVRATFTGPVRFVLKGSRDPHNIVGPGAGFGLSWQGGTHVTIGYSDDQQELVQVTSDTMQLIIPDLQRFLPKESRRTSGPADSSTSDRVGTQKVCAKFTNGVRMGLGFVFERTCAPKCAGCPEDPFYRRCRLFTFKPHYQVQTRARSVEDHDSFQGFRSDFIHMSFSLTSPIAPTTNQHAGHNSIYLSPLAFQHFWQWWELFDNTMSLRIRQGKLFPDNVKDSKKFGRFIATIKFRFAIERLFITHVYRHDTRDAWTKGETPFIGAKAFMQSLHADLHQSAQEMSTRREGKAAIVSKHKKFNAVEVIIAGLELRAMAAVFAEPQKQLISLKRASDQSLRPWDDMEPHDVRSRWVDIDDFVELLWTATDKKPRIYLSHLASCPRFTFSKHSTFREPWEPQSTAHGIAESSAVSKFGTEDSHVCLLGKEPSAKHTQMNLASQRLQQLLGERRMTSSRDSSDSPVSQTSSTSSDDPNGSPTGSVLTPEQSLDKKIELLQEYIEQLGHNSQTSSEHVYYMPLDSVDASAWAEFGNVYHVHSPNIFFNNSNRNLLLTYYQASRKRRGFEYHMATRAVKFLHDLAIEDNTRRHTEDVKRPWIAVDGAQAAVDAFRNLLGTEKTSTEGQGPDTHEPFSPSDPLRGWSDGVALSKSHYCVLFKPQFVLQSQKCDDACVVVTASDISLQNFRVIDVQNQDDPVTGHIMNRNHAGVNGLQVFSPTSAGYPLDARRRASHNIPLEVLVDYRCECNDFDRLVPQTQATFHYDKFNRNRPRASTSVDVPSHIAHQMDLVVVNMPRFSVSAKCKNFEAISSVVTDLLLFSDPAHKSRIERLETFLFSYDFTDLDGAADLVSKLQMRIRQLQVVERGYAVRTDILDATERLDLLSVDAQIFVLAEELNLVFDAIAMAQDQNTDLHEDQQSALKLLVSSREISWHMLDDRASLLAKLEVLGVVFSWLSKQDGSTSNDLVLKDMRALHSSPTALWPEILMMHDQPANHPMMKAKQFAHAVWTVLPPVGGISIYSNFQLDLHPIRLQIEAEVGRKLLEYVWPARRARNGTQLLLVDDGIDASSTNDSSIATLDRPKTRQDTLAVSGNPPRERGLARPRSHNNLRVHTRPTLHRFKSSTALNEASDGKSDDDRRGMIKRAPKSDEEMGAAAMRMRSTQQKTFFRVHIPRLHVLLSARSDDFFCNEALLYTNEINIYNRTTSFEEMVTQFMPANPTWKGWVRLALSQPIIPVLPVAKELFTKTKWGSKAAASQKNLLRSGTSATSPPPVRQGTKHFWNIRHRKNSEEAERPERSRSRSRGRPIAVERNDSSPPRNDNIIISVQEASPSVDHSFL